jgi:hypothetical protein
MSTALAQVDTRSAIAEMTSFDAVKDIRAQALAMQAYAKEAQDRERLDEATEIQLLAEIRAGEMLLSLGERRGGDQTSNERSLLSNEEMGVTDKQSSRWKRLAGLSPDDRNAMIAEAKDKVAAALAREKRSTAGDKAKSSPLVKAWNKASDEQRQKFYDAVEASFLESIGDARRRRIYAKLTGQALPTRPVNVPLGRDYRAVNRDIS